MRHLILMCAGAISGCSDYSLETTPAHASNADPIIEVSPLVLDFWTIGGSETATLSFQIRSLGTAPLTVEQLLVQGSDAFTLVDPSADFMLETDEVRSVDVVFSPAGLHPAVGSVVVFSDDPVSPEVEVELLGEGRVPWLTISPDPHDFGHHLVPCGDDVVLTLQNTGTDDLHIDSLAYEGGDSLALSAAAELPITLSPGALTELTVRLEPAASGDAQGVLTVGSDDPRGDLTATQTATLTSAGTGVDLFDVNTSPPVDILFAVDQSCSMDDDAAALADNFSTFIDTLEAHTTGWRVGVVTYDAGCVNDAVFDASSPDVRDRFADAVVLGEDADVVDDEALFQLVDRALDRADDGSCNAGLLRDGALLHVVVVSDEPERSTEHASAWTWDYWLARFQAHVASPDLLLVSGVVDTDGCGEGAAQYEDAIAATGGQSLSICSGDWGAHASDLAAASTGFLHSYTLTQAAVADSVDVRVDGAQSTVPWRYDPALNAVLFDTRPDGVSVAVTYDLSSTCPEG